MDSFFVGVIDGDRTPWEGVAICAIPFRHVEMLRRSDSEKKLS